MRVLYPPDLPEVTASVIRMFLYAHFALYFRNFQGSLSPTIQSWIPLMWHSNPSSSGPQPFLKRHLPVLALPPALIPSCTEVFTIPFSGFCLSSTMPWHMLCLPPISASFMHFFTCQRSAELDRRIWEGHQDADLENNQGRLLGGRGC